MGVEEWGAGVEQGEVAVRSRAGAQRFDRLGQGELFAGKAADEASAADFAARFNARGRPLFLISDLGRGVALSSVVVSIATVSGPVLAALILSVASWRWWSA